MQSRKSTATAEYETQTTPTTAPFGRGNGQGFGYQPTHQEIAKRAFELRWPAPGHHHGWEWPVGNRPWALALRGARSGSADGARHRGGGPRGSCNGCVAGARASTHSLA